MIKIVLTNLLLVLTLAAQAQLDFEKFKVNFRNIGPAGMSGRVTAIDVDLSNDERIYIGSASGGVWLSENGGTNWRPIFDDQPTLSIGALKIDQSNPDVIWVGTGEGNPRNSLNTGGGIYKSIDGGKTWKSMGLEKTKAIHRIIINKDNPDVVYAGCIGSPWGDSDRGVYRTQDGGKTWKRVLYIDGKTGVGDMVVDPANPNHIIVGMYEHRRTPWDFVSGGPSSGMYVTYDGGDNWKEITDKEGLPKGDLGRMGIAFSASNPNIVYALVEAKVNGLYKSTNGGDNWRLVSTENIGNRPFYYSEIYVDPQNENRIWNLWTYLSKSEDGGKSFEIMADYGNAVHPDHHALWIHPDNPSYVINGNDGGLNFTYDMGRNWRFVENLPIGQFYHVNIDNDFPYNVYGGMQDNGSWVGPSMVLKSGGIRNSDFQELYFGDGFDVVPNPEDSRYGYAMSQGGNVGYYDRVTGAQQNAKPVHPDDIRLRYNWNAPIAQDPFNTCGVYFGSQFLHYSDDCGINWKMISPDLTTNDTMKQKQDKSGGLTMDATMAENNTCLLSIAPSSLDKNVIWVGTDDGKLQLTQDGGQTWNDIYSRLRGAPKAAYIPQIVVSNKNAGEAFVVVNNYRQNDYTPYAYHTKDFGKSWTRIADASQIGGFVLSIVQDPVEPKLLFMGTDVGLYYSLDYGKKWQRFDGKLFPHVQVADLKIQERESDLVIGTFGRSFWILDDIKPFRKFAQEGVGILKDSLTVFEPAPVYQVSTRSYDGVRFNAQAGFVGDNKSISYAKIRIHTPETKGKQRHDIKLQIVDSQGDTIRTVNRKVRGGMGTVAWFLEEDGVQRPSRREPRKDADAPSGLTVLPGTYTAVLTFGGQTKSVPVEVKSDPRMEVSRSVLVSQRANAKKVQEYQQKAADGMKIIRDAKASVKAVKGLMASQPEDVQKEIKSMHKNISSQLDTLEKLYFDPPGLKGIQRNPNTLGSKLGSASRYAQTGWRKSGNNAQYAMDAATTRVDSAIEAINKFVDGDWKKYQDYIGGLTFNPLKEVMKVGSE